VAMGTTRSAESSQLQIVIVDNEHSQRSRTLLHGPGKHRGPYTFLRKVRKNFRLARTRMRREDDAN
jgi:hypothetical protein